MTEVRPDSIQFCRKETWFGIVLMVREAVRDLLTHEERGEAINAVAITMKGYVFP